MCVLALSLPQGTFRALSEATFTRLRARIEAVARRTAEVRDEDELWDRIMMSSNSEADGG